MPATVLTSRLGTFAIAVFFWTALGVLFALPSASSPVDFRGGLLEAVPQWWGWGLVTVAIIAVDRRLPFTDAQLGRRLLAHVPLGAVFTIAELYVVAAIQAVLGLGSWSAVFSTAQLTMALRGMALWSLLIYWLIFGGWTAYRYHQRLMLSEVQRERIERLSSEARLQALRYQLDPHFLFNALNTISSQLEADPRLARQMIEHLGDLLRATLCANGQPHATVDEELALLDHYLAIQRIRFGERLHVEIDVDDGARRALVPSMLLQPLVENAIRHGLAPRIRGGTVRIWARAVGDHALHVRVEDDGDGLPDGWSLASSAGLGLSITQQRLAGVYAGAPHRLDVSPRPGGGTAVDVVVPLERVGSTRETVAHA